MKLRLLIVIMVLVLGLGLTGCTQTPPPQPDIPRYTADQVIDVARAYYPATEAEKRWMDIAWEVKYIGEGVWQVDRILVLLEGSMSSDPPGTRYHNQSWFFYENTGELLLAR